MQRRTTEQKTTSADSELGWLRSPEEREVFESLDITNAVVFALVMMRNPDLCKRVIEASIGRIVDEVSGYHGEIHHGWHRLQGGEARRHGLKRQRHLRCRNAGERRR